MNGSTSIWGSALAAVVLCGTSWAQTTRRVSVSSGGVQGNDTSEGCVVSADGRYVAFQSRATNLVAGDVGGYYPDVFVHDLQTGVTELVSSSSRGMQGNESSGDASLSADGRYVAFSSYASNLVPLDTNGSDDVFVHDRQTGTTERVSVDANGIQGNMESYAPSISADGRYVAFRSRASNFVSPDSPMSWDIFVHDRQTGGIERVSVNTAGASANGESYFPRISADGRYVVFDSLAGNLVAGDTNAKSDVFLRDRQAGTTELVSVSMGGTTGNNFSYAFSVSADGRYVGFDSAASDLVPGDSNGTYDAYVRDRLNGTTELVSVSSSGVQGDARSEMAYVSADGRYVAFYGDASNLVPGDTIGTYDVFVHDRQSGTTEMVSRSTGGAQGNGMSICLSISADGRYVTFFSYATNLVSGDTNGFVDAFVRDRGTPGLVAHCFGDGTAGACPCSNLGDPGRGCENSAGTGGALLAAGGDSDLSSDTLVLISSGERNTAFSLFLQGDATIAPAIFGDGLRCTGGTLKRLYTKNASGGVASAPGLGDPSISVRSAALGDPIPTNGTRQYQTYYRDPVSGFCPSPPGDTWNISSALSIVWSP